VRRRSGGAARRGSGGTPAAGAELAGTGALRADVAATPRRAAPRASERLTGAVSRGGRGLARGGGEDG
jgi:hypothetical protein